MRKGIQNDVQELEAKYLKLFKKLNKEQKVIYDIVLRVVNKNGGRLFLVYGHGGIGKTYIWQTIILKIQSDKKIILTIASLGIASLLQSSGWTIYIQHSKYQFKLMMLQHVRLKGALNLQDLIESTSLIVWDETLMNHRKYFEELDKILKDILQK